mgnify:CR=1 FL=1
MRREFDANLTCCRLVLRHPSFGAPNLTVLWPVRALTCLVHAAPHFGLRALISLRALFVFETG